MSLRFAVCDDDQDYARYIESLAAHWARAAGTALEVERFPSAQAFLFRYEERRDFDVLLLDIEMDGMDGVALAKAVRRDNDDIQIVFVTGYADYIAQGYEVSALHYLTKPVDPDKLSQVLTRAVGRLRRNAPALTLERQAPPCRAGEGAGQPVFPGGALLHPEPGLCAPGVPDGGGAHHRRAHPPAPGAVRKAQPGHH